MENLETGLDKPYWALAGQGSIQYASNKYWKCIEIYYGLFLLLYLLILILHLYILRIGIEQARQVSVLCQSHYRSSRPHGHEFEFPFVLSGFPYSLLKKTCVWAQTISV